MALFASSPSKAPANAVLLRDTTDLALKPLKLSSLWFLRPFGSDFLTANLIPYTKKNNVFEEIGVVAGVGFRAVFGSVRRERIMCVDVA